MEFESVKSLRKQVVGFAYDRPIFIAVLLGLLVYVLSIFLSYDDFIRGPEAILLKENEPYKSDYIDHFIHGRKGVLLLYYILDAIFAMFLAFGLWKYISDAELGKLIEDTTWGKRLEELKFPGIYRATGFLAIMIYLFSDVIQNGLGVWAYMDDGVVFSQDGYDCFDLSKKIALYTSIAFVLVGFLNKRLKANKKLAEGFFDGDFKKLIPGATIMLSVVFLLANLDQGPVIIWKLMESRCNIFLVLFLLMTIVGMTIVNTYYSSLESFKDNWKHYKKNRWWVPGTFNWSEVKGDINKDSEIVNTRISLFVRIFATSFIWAAMYVLIKAMDNTTRNFNISPYVILGVTIIGSLLVYLKYEIRTSIMDTDSNVSTNYYDCTIKKGFPRVVNICLALVLILLVWLGFTGDSQLVDRWFLSIGILFFLNFLVVYFLLYRRRVAYLPDDLFLGDLHKRFANDTTSKVLQGVVSFAIIGLAIRGYATSCDHIYEVSTAAYILAAIILVFYIGQMLMSFRVKVAFINYIQKQKGEDLELFKKNIANRDFDLYRANLKRKYIIGNLALLICSLSFFKNISSNPHYGSQTIPDFTQQTKVNCPAYQDSLSESSSIRHSYQVDLLNYLTEFTSRPGPYYVIANEGGGLRANYWTLNILNELDKLSDGSLYSRLFATCGASGGAVGQGLYNIMKQQGLSYGQRQTAIKSIGETDFLARDAFNLFFDRIPKYGTTWTSDGCSCEVDRKKCEKRGDYVMARKYGIFSSDNSSIITGSSYSYNLRDFDWPFEQFWADAYSKECGFPLTLINSAHVETGEEGIISPLRNQDKIFNGSSVISDRGLDKSISYIESVFLVNRFPVVSPHAVIKGKGSFIDAGAFDNLGITSIMDLLTYIERMAATKKGAWKTNWEKLTDSLHLIAIFNGDESYYKRLEHTSEWQQDLSDLYLSGNLQSNLKTAASTTAVKEYMLKYAKQKKGVWFQDVHEIALPYLIEHRSSLNKTFKGQILSGMADYDFINRQDSALKTNYVAGDNFYLKPPLGRVLSKPVQRYMDCIIEDLKFVDKNLRVIPGF